MSFIPRDVKLFTSESGNPYLGKDSESERSTAEVGVAGTARRWEYSEVGAVESESIASIVLAVNSGSSLPKVDAL